VVIGRKISQTYVIHPDLATLGFAARARFEEPIIASLTGVNPIRVTIPKDWLSVADVCSYLEVSPFVITARLRSGDLPGVKVGREWRVARQDLEDWLNQRRAGVRQ
jgi:excisionase family DNA binding protein